MSVTFNHAASSTGSAMTRTMRRNGERALVAGVFALFGATAAASTPVEVQKLLAKEMGSETDFGVSVAVDGDTAVIGATDTEGSNHGAVYVFTRSASGEWKEKERWEPVHSGATSFGSSVAVDGDTIVIGEERGLTDRTAYVSTRDAGGDWSEPKELTVSDPETLLQSFGRSVAVDGDTIVIGDHLARVENEVEILVQSGAAYVFTRDAGGDWSQLQRLDDVADLEWGASFGQSVAIDGDTMLIGAPLADVATDLDRRGRVYVFTRDASGLWSRQQPPLEASDPRNNVRFGWSVAVDGDTAVIGARGFAPHVWPGQAYIFARDADGYWSQLQGPLVPGDDVGDEYVFFGSSVAIAGDRIVIGASHEDYLEDDSDGLRNSGAAYVYARDAGGYWSEQRKLLASIDLDGDDVGAHDHFGYSVATDGSIAMIGARREDGESAPDRGATYVFTLDDQGPITSGATATPNPVAVNTATTLTAHVDDAATGGSAIASASYTVDGGPAVAMASQDGSFDEVAEDVTAHLPAFATAGIHELCVSGTDDAGNTGAEECVLLATYDPDGGFVSGGGWIDSPANACYLTEECKGLAGTANFGFTSKYTRRPQTPTGNTSFRFTTGDLHFDSNSYEWLVIAGHKAQYKGTGTINGAGNYGFMLFAIDAELTPSTDVDLFRIKIWDKNYHDFVVYDNEVGASDDADPTTQIGGGAIVIQAARD